MDFGECSGCYELILSTCENVVIQCLPEKAELHARAGNHVLFVPCGGDRQLRKAGELFDIESAFEFEVLGRQLLIEESNDDAGQLQNIGKILR